MIKDMITLLRGVEKKLSQIDHAIISIDGIDGSGKSYLSEYLSNALHCKAIHFDDYLEQNKGSFLEALDYKSIKEDIATSLNKNKYTIIEGVCLLQVGKEIDSKPNCAIYVKKLYYNIWKGGELYKDAKNAEERICLEERQLNTFAIIEAGIEKTPPPTEDTKLSKMRCELIKYHWLYRPEKISDFIFAWESQKKST